MMGAAPALLSLKQRAVWQSLLALGLLIVIGGGAYVLHKTPGSGATASFSLLVGAAIGIVFERGRFCFFCILRDVLEPDSAGQRNSGGVFAILTALAVGGIGYAIVFGAFLPNAGAGRLPPQAHIGPVSYVLVAAGFAFGVGMALSGACISGHLYRLGEGYARAPIALLGALIGFGIGFLTWYTLYVDVLVRAPVVWLPSTFGYAGSLLIHLAVLGGLAFFLLRYLPEVPQRLAGKITVRSIYRSLTQERWNPIATGALVGILGVFLYFRVEPLGVTAQLGSISRTLLDNAGVLAERLPGLDTFAGCATQVVQTIMDNGWLIGGLVVGSFAAALLSNRFQISQLTLRNATTALLGGILQGWGAMIALGCTVGTLLSGISAFALSGWVFAIAVVVGVWLGIRLRLHQS